jgi:hypothetical protein
LYIFVALKAHTEESISLKANPVTEKMRVNKSVITLKKLPKETADYEIKLFKVGSSNTSLRQCVESNIRIFRRDCAFYEFTHEMERISEDKELIFMKVCEPNG